MEQANKIHFGADLILASGLQEMECTRELHGKSCNFVNSTSSS